MPPDNTARIFQKGYSKGTRAGHDASKNEATIKTGAVLPAQPDERPDAIGELWPQVFLSVRMNENTACDQGGGDIAHSNQRDHG